MGQYAHGNQPIQPAIYFYNYAREPWKTQEKIRYVLDNLYGPGPDGYCGDEDNGHTSAWYVFSALGFYPVAPVTCQYVIGSPLFEKAEISTRKAIELSPDFADAYSNLGNILSDQGKLQEADLSYLKAIEIKPNYAEAHYNLGTILKYLGKLQEAELSTRKAIEINPNLANADLTL